MAIARLTLPRRRHRRRPPHEVRPPFRRTLWLMPLVVSLLINIGVLFPVLRVEHLIGGLLAIGFVVIASRRPDRALLAVIAFLPFNNMVLSWLFKLGFPAQVVSMLTYWKELLIVSVAVAGVREFVRAGKRPDAFDWLAASYIALVVLHGLFPRLFNPLAPISSTTRTQGVRFASILAVIALAARHAPLPQDFGKSVTKAIMWSATVVAACGVYEFFFSYSWNHIMVFNLGMTRYLYDVLKVPLNLVGNPYDLRTPSDIGTGLFRVGSVFNSPLELGFYLVPGLAIAIERCLRSGAATGIASAALIALALMATQTRAAALAAVVMIFLAFRGTPGRAADRRVKLAMIFGAALLFIVPASGATHLSARSAQATGQTSETSSENIHIVRLKYGWKTMVHNPWGQGVGTSAGVGQRFNNVTGAISENYYLQVGDELGVLAMLAFIAMNIALLSRLRWAARTFHDDIAGALWGAGWGLAAGCFLLHVWNSLALACMFWGASGAMIGIAERRQAQEEGSASSDTTDSNVSARVTRVGFSGAPFAPSP